MDNLGIIEKIESTHTNLRTNTMEGVFSDFPKLNEAFVIYGKGLKFGNRVIYTSPVKEIIELGKNKDSLEYMLFKTENSTYRITLLESAIDGKSYLEEVFMSISSDKATIN